jgi:hypothetical protein
MGGGWATMPEATASGSNSWQPEDPPPAVPTEVYGAPVDLDGKMPNLRTKPILYSIIVTGFSADLDQTSQMAYYHSIGATFGLCFYCNGNRVLWSDSPDKYYGNIGSLSNYAKMNSYGFVNPGWREGHDASAGCQFGYWGYITIYQDQPWWVPPDETIIPDQAGVYISIVGGDVSFSAKAAFWWS